MNEILLVNGPLSKMGGEKTFPEKVPNNQSNNRYYILKMLKSTTPNIEPPASKTGKEFTWSNAWSNAQLTNL